MINYKGLSLIAITSLLFLISPRDANAWDKSGHRIVGELAENHMTESTIKAVEALLEEKLKVAHVSVQWVNPLPPDLKNILSKYKKVLIPEVNTGQFRKIIRSEFLVDAVGLNEVRGKPMRPASIIDKAKELINE